MVTIVSGYWNVKNKNGTNETYLKWFENTLSFNCPYVFFGDKNSIEIIKKFRKDLPTYYVELEIKDFYTYKFYDTIITNDTHCPSKELRIIWLEKIFLVKKAIDINPFNSEFFMWMDAGICTHRDKKPSNKPFPSPEKIKYLPPNKFIFSSSDQPKFIDYAVKDNTYYHFIAMTNFIIHKNIIGDIVNIYKKYLDIKLTLNTWIFTDQVLITHIYKDCPELFFHYAHGYGDIVNQLE
jgi:hypothetical protein